MKKFIPICVLAFILTACSSTYKFHESEQKGLIISDYPVKYQYDTINGEITDNVKRTLYKEGDTTNFHGVLWANYGPERYDYFVQKDSNSYYAFRKKDVILFFEKNRLKDYESYKGEDEYLSLWGIASNRTGFTSFGFRISLIGFEYGKYSPDLNPKIGDQIYTSPLEYYSATINFDNVLHPFTFGVIFGASTQEYVKEKDLLNLSINKQKEGSLVVGGFVGYIFTPFTVEIQNFNCMMGNFWRVKLGLIFPF